LICYFKYKYVLNNLFCFCAVCCLLFAAQLTLRAQDEAAIRPLIKEKDLKKLEKAEGIKVDAEKLIEEANQLNMEVFTVQADPNLDEKAITKKTALLESQAQQKQIQASALYEKCNEIKFILYKQYLDEFWNAHAGEESNYLNAKLLEEQASDNYFQATSYRIEAKKMDDGYTKVEKLTEANNLENKGIQKQLTALGIYHGIGESVSEEAPPVENVPAVIPEKPIVDVNGAMATPVITSPETFTEKTLPEQPEINQSMIDEYNRYIATGQFTDTTLSTGQIAGITAFDSDRILQLWYEYIYGGDVLGTEPVITAQADTMQVIEKDQSTTRISPAASGEKEIGIVTDENKDTLIPADDEVIYRVQVAANRSALSQRALSRMYYGNKNVEMINENGWYKYSVGDFTTYEEASQFRKSSSISNAFVVAYRKGTRFHAGTSEVYEKQQSIFTPAGEQRLPPGLIFRIQVAASRVPLTVGQLKRIYQGNYPIELISEDGWYKYQFMGVRLYSDALQIVRNVTTTGAFIVAYENNTKINLADAVRKNKELENTVKALGRKGQIQEIEFHLQLAASRIAMPPYELKTLYGGPEPVSVIVDDEWYKYHLKAGNSPETAEQFRQSCGITKAFIVAYQRAKKINYFEAIQETK
jgi:hypothetical protein